MRFGECKECNEYKYLKDGMKCVSCSTDEDEVDPEIPDRIFCSSKAQMLAEIAQENGWNIDDVELTHSITINPRENNLDEESDIE